MGSGMCVCPTRINVHELRERDEGEAEDYNFLAARPLNNSIETISELAKSNHFTAAEQTVVTATLKTARREADALNRYSRRSNFTPKLNINKKLRTITVLRSWQVP